MKDIYSNLLRLALTAGLTQRELFIEKVSAYLSDKMESSPETGERIAAGIVSLAESLKNELLMRDLFASRNDTSSNQELTDRLNELNHTLKELTDVLKQRS